MFSFVVVGSLPIELIIGDSSNPSNRVVRLPQCYDPLLLMHTYTQTMVAIYVWNQVKTIIFLSIQFSIIGHYPLPVICIPIPILLTCMLVLNLNLSVSLPN